LTAIASSWLVRTLDRLEVMGLTERRPHLADRRARSLAVTEDARQVLPLLWNIVGETLREALTGLSTKEIAILAKALNRVIANLSALDRPTATDSVKAHASMATPTKSQKKAIVRWSLGQTVDLRGAKLHQLLTHPMQRLSVRPLSSAPIATPHRSPWAFPTPGV